MECLRCGKPTESKALCAECFEQGRRLSPERLEKVREAVSSDVRREQRSAYLGPLIAIGTTIFLAVLYVLIRGPTPPKPLPATIVNAVAGPAQSLADACRGSQRCLIGYITPWCPGCRGSLTFIRQAREYLPTLGHRSSMQIIVGDGPSDQLHSLAEEVGGHVFIDEDGSISRALRVGGVPAWFLVNQDGAIIDRASAGGPYGVPIQDLFRFFIPQIFSKGELQYFLPASA